MMLFGVSHIKNNLNKGVQALNPDGSEVSTRVEAKPIPSVQRRSFDTQKARDPSIRISAVSAQGSPCLVASM